jgi:NADH-quinone oxidoreductase subunit A
MSDLVLFVLIFVLAGAGLLAANLVLGWFVRPDKPSPEKAEVYECGEQPIGSAWVQFDLRFYVVALLFVIFDVELAFFFPWAVVFGSATRAGDESKPADVRAQAAMELQPRYLPGDKVPLTGSALTPEEMERLKVSSKAVTMPPPDPAAMRGLARVAFADILVFFGVLLVGFAYLWRRGDLAWVRSTAAQHAPNEQRPPVVAGGPGR